MSTEMHHYGWYDSEYDEYSEFTMADDGEFYAYSVVTWDGFILEVNGAHMPWWHAVSLLADIDWAEIDHLCQDRYCEQKRAEEVA